MSDKICNDGLSEVNNMLNNVSTTGNDNNNNASICANCGKEGDKVNNICNKCKMVKYCNAACKKKHRHKHKKYCERRVAELHDEKLFKQPPPLYGDCPICFLLLPTYPSGSTYYACCGKLYAMDVLMHLNMITKGIKLIMRSVHFVELHHVRQMRS